MPYADEPGAYWTGYFTSRPILKLMVKETGRYLQKVRNFINTKSIMGK